jgi:hypothetical protein
VASKKNHPPVTQGRPDVADAAAMLGEYNFLQIDTVSEHDCRLPIMRQQCPGLMLLLPPPSGSGQAGGLPR